MVYVLHYKQVVLNYPHIILLLGRASLRLSMPWHSGSPEANANIETIFLLEG